MGSRLFNADCSRVMLCSDTLICPHMEDERRKKAKLLSQRDRLLKELRDNFEYLDGWCQMDDCPGYDKPEEGRMHCFVCSLRRSILRAIADIEKEV